MRVSATSGGPRDRDAALAAAGEPVLRAVPGYTLATDMETARLIVVSLPAGAHVVGATSSNNDVLGVGNIAVAAESTAGALGAAAASVYLNPMARGRARITVQYSDGSESVGHYQVLPPLSTAGEQRGEALVKRLLAPARLSRPVWSGRKRDAVGF